MKIKMKKICLSFLTLLTILCSSTMSVRADKLPCNVTISVTDMIEACDGTVTVTISTVSGVQMFDFSVDKRGAEGAQTYSFMDYGDANVIASVDKAGWEVVDATTFAPVNTISLVDGGEISLDLLIMPTKDNENYGQVANLIEQGENVVNNLLTEIEAPQDDVVLSTEPTNVEGAEEVFTRFKDATAFIETDESWKSTLETYDLLYRISQKDVYLSTVNGATEEEWNNMTPYEIFVYTESYLRFSNMVGSDAKPADTYINNGDKGIENFMKNNYGSLAGNGVDDVKEALHELVLWQVDYYRAYNFPYNFVTGKSYAEETALDLSGKTEEIVDEDLGITEEEEEEIIDAFKEEQKEQNSIWKNVLDMLLSRWFTLVLLAVAIVAWLIVRHIRKKSGIDEMSSDGK